MSETRFLWTLSALPADPSFVATAEALASSLALFKDLVPASRHVAERFDDPRFFGSEQFSYSARCPVCAAVVHRDKTPGTAGRRWFAEVDAIGAHRGAANTSVTWPGCGHTVSISAIDFEFPIGAARCALTAHFEVWLDEWFSEDSKLPAEPLAALSSSLGTPLLFVRAFLAMLPTDRLTIERLASADDDARIAAASALDALPPGHFEDNWMDPGYIHDHADALLAAWHGTAHPLVRRRVLGLLGGAQYSSQGLRDVVEAELKSATEGAGDGPLCLPLRDRRRTAAARAADSAASRARRWQRPLALRARAQQLAGIRSGRSVCRPRACARCSLSRAERCGGRDAELGSERRRPHRRCGSGRARTCQRAVPHW